MIDKVRKVFEENGYVHIPNFLDQQSCRDITSEFYRLREEGKNLKDSQVPKADSFGYQPELDRLLEQLTPNIETVVQRKLFPTYAYGRIYKPGDDLRFHVDRPSCEVSATITLSFRGNPWPIYMCKEENNCLPINMEIGDAVVYKGCDIIHGREKYTQGEEQVQVFLHWVYQDGERAEFKYDKRKELSHHSLPAVNNKFKIKNWGGLFWELPNLFSKEACESLIKKFETGNEDKYEPGYIGLGDERTINKQVRDVNRIITSTIKGIGATLTGIGLNANHNLWKFNLTDSNQCEFLRYDKDGHFNMHIDTFLGDTESPWARKLSVLLFLNDDFEGGKFYFPGAEGNAYPSQNQGDVIIFPSFLLHGVEPVKSGIRRTIITWLVGPYFK